MKNIISNEAIEQVMTRIDALAVKLGVTAEYLFGIYVKQAYINSVIGICGITMIFVLLLGMIPVGVWFCKRIRNKEICTEWHFAWAAPMGVLTLIFLMSLTIELNNIVSGFINPEYYAFKEILKNIK